MIYSTIKKLILILVIFGLVTFPVFAEKPDPVNKPPLQVKEQNLDDLGWIAVHEQGVADVKVTEGEINATIVNTPNVNVGNTPDVNVVDMPGLEMADPLYVRDIHSPGLSNAYWATYTSSWQAAADFGTSFGPIIDSGQRGVIRHVSMRFVVPTGQIPITAQLRSPHGSGQATVLLVLNYQGTAGAYDYYVASQPVHIYIITGNNPNFHVSRSSSSGLMLVSISVVGYTISAP